MGGDASFGKYRLIAELGNGGMADVFLAVLAGPAGSGFRKLSVIKRLRQNLVDDPEFVAMLIEEARIAARLNHSNVVQTNEVGQVGDHYFIAMEYLDGQPLHRVQHRATQREKATGTPSVGKDQQMVILMDALAGLHHAHELADYDGSPLGIVHRDVTPQNIFVTYDGQVKVVDFGIAKAAGRASETRAGVVKGKIRYMAPEQATMANVDRRADVFSVGVMLWEVAAGRRMWPKMDDLEIAHMLLAETFPTSPRAVDPTVDEALDRVCQKALAPKPDDRYSSAEEFRADLEEYLANTGQLVSARRKLSPAVTELFDDKRSAIKGVIEKQLAALDVQTSGEFKAVALAPDGMLSSSSTSGISLAQAPGGGNPSGFSGMTQTFSQTLVSSEKKARPRRSHSLADVPPPQPKRSERLPRILAGVVVVAALAAVGFVFVRRTTEHAAVAAPLAQPAMEDISFRINVTPASARVVIDDESPRPAPLDLRVKKDNRNHRVRIEADGYAPRTEMVRFAGNLVLSFDLRSLGGAAATGEPAKPDAPKTEPTKPGAGAVQPVVVKNTSAPVVAKVEPGTAPPPTPVAPTPAPGDPPKPPKPPKAVIDNGDPWANR